MKFDFVIGNPPYQEEAESESTSNGQKPRKNIFQHFQIQADKIAKESSVLIYPGGRWMHQSGKGLKQFFKFNYGTINVGLAALTKGARLFMLECITGRGG